MIVAAVATLAEVYHHAPMVRVNVAQVCVPTPRTSFRIQRIVGALSCGNICGENQLCVEGVCQCITLSGSQNQYCASSDSDGCTETDVTQDFFNCGSCGNVCGNNQICNGGYCQCIELPAGFGLQLCAVPNSKNCAVAELASDASNCGSCGTVCTEGKLCSGSTCQCPPGLQVCVNACTILSADHFNCGRCGNVCQATTQCVESNCVYLQISCPADFSELI